MTLAASEDVGFPTLEYRRRDVGRQLHEPSTRGWKKITALFNRQATLLATAAGVMQANRMLREHPDPKLKIFRDEDEAYAWAADPAPPA